jgi:hypothetical protein
LPEAIPGRRIPDRVDFSELSSAPLSGLAVPLPQANTLAHLNYRRGSFGRLIGQAGETLLFNPEFILVKFKNDDRVKALHVEPGRELAAARVVSARPDVEFAVVDTFERRQFAPDDPLLPDQWHHQVVGSELAWSYGLGNSSARIAIVDTPFQMDHPDLAANTDSGWDAVLNVPVTASEGIYHSTLCAGMAAAAIDNAVGGAGAANCRVLPVNINGAISEMYNAVIWAADHGVRVVNISWSGATNAVLEAAGLYLKNNARGLLVMSAMDGQGALDGPNQPDVYCVSMTDAADNFQGTQYGAYIDFAAPGYAIYGPVTGGGYGFGTGCSYAAPLFAGVAAWMLALNPTLGADDVISILQSTAVDLGPPGWDEYYGWGRIDFGAAAAQTAATIPLITSVQRSSTQVNLTATYRPGLNYSLWRTTNLVEMQWTLVTNAVVATTGGLVMLADPAPDPSKAFYTARALAP